MKKIKLFEQFSVEEYEMDKIYESWISENGNDLRMIVEQLENGDEEEEEEKSKDDEAYDWLADDTISAGEERALGRDMQLLTKGQMAALYLKAKGKYNLIYEKEIIPIIIDKKENTHTITLSDIQEFIVTHDKFGYVFRKCESKLNGNMVDFFENGKVRLIGSFENGLAIGYLTEFYPNGELKEIRLFDKKGFLLKKVVPDE